jgi:hypothetical protein
MSVGKIQKNAVEVEPGVVIQRRAGKVIKNKIRNRGWSVASQSTFLDHLAATCNVKASAAAAKVGKTTAYRLQRRNPEFAAAWQEALNTGYVVLETLLVGRAIKALQIEKGVTDVADPDAMSTEMALRVLDRHFRTVKGSIKMGGPIPRRATEEEARDAILAKLDILQKRIAAGEA